MERLMGGPRFGQLTYAAFDRGDGSGGGWHVHAQTDDLSEAEIEALRKHAVIAFGETHELPAFPTQDQVAAFPRRLSYFPLYSAAQGNEQPELLGHAFVHAAPAGLDTTQRPGNVFSHMLIDRDAAATEHRPVQLWRAPEFRTPYGPKAVIDASLPDSSLFAQPGPYVTPAGVHNFIIDDASQRLPVLAMLLDSTRAAVNGTGPRVVLGTDSPDRAAFWIAAVSMLTTDEWARHLGWSLFERAADLPGAWSRGVHIAAVPRQDLDHIDANSVIVIDELADGHSLGSFETTPPTPHRSAHGSSVDSTAWSDLVVYLLQVHADRMPQVFERLDAIAALEFTPLEVPEWALAMATVQLGLDDVDEITRDTIVRATPIEVTEVPWLTNDAVSAITRGSEDGTASAYGRLLEATPDPNTLGYSLLYRGYLALALGDDEWLSQPDQVPLPNGEVPSLADDETLSEAAELALKRPVDELQADGTRNAAALRALRTIDLLLRAKLLPPQPPTALTAQGRVQLAAVELLQALERALLTHEDRAAAVLPHAGRLSLATRLFIAIGVFGPLSTPPAGPAAFQQISPTTLRWIRQLGMPVFVERAEAQLEATPQQAPTDSPPRVNQLAFELALQDTLQHHHLPAPRVLLFGSFERTNGSWLSFPAQVRELFEPLLPQRLDLLAQAEHWYPGEVPAEIVDLVLLQAAPSQELSRLTQLLNAAAHNPQCAGSRSDLLIQARDAADQYRLKPEISTQMMQHLQTLALKRFSPAQQIAQAELPSAATGVALHTPLLAPTAAVGEEGPRINLEVYAPMIVAAAGFNALSGQHHLSNEQLRLVHEATKAPALPLLLRAFVALAQTPTINMATFVTTLIERSLLAAGLQPAQLVVAQTLSSPVLDHLEYDAEDSRRQGRRFTVYDAVIRQLCSTPDALPTRTMLAYRDSLIEHYAQAAGDDKEQRRQSSQAQKAVKKHFEAFEPRSGSLLGGLFKLNKNEGEN